MPLTFRQAQPSDQTLLEYWDRQPHVIAASGPNDEWDWQSDLQQDFDWREMLIFERQGRPIGIVQIIDPKQEKTHYWGDVEPNLRALDIWIGEAKDLGKGYGTEMMMMSLNRCFEKPEVTAVLIDPLASNNRAVAFYERLGFRFVEARNFDGDDCLVYQISRSSWEERKS